MRSINLGRWSRRVERYFNIKGGGGLMDVEPSIRVSLPIASGVEERFLEGWNRYAFAISTAAVAAQTSGAQLRNPAGSNVVAVIERCAIRLTTATTLSVMSIGMGQPGTDLANAITPRSLDFRNNTGSSMSASQANTVSPTFGIGSMTVSNGLESNFIQTVDQEVTLLPNDIFRVVDATVNESFVLSLMWRERAMEASEFTG